MTDDRGSAIPLMLGFFIVAIVTVAAAVALGDAFVQQRDLQDICDGAAAAAAAAGADLGRNRQAPEAHSLRFADVRIAVTTYLRRDSERRTVHVRASLSADAARITLSCEQTRPLAFGALFGRRHVRHVATSSARAALLD
jgi:uncharacterized membrane protein